MNVDCSSVILKGVCEGCLSLDRDLNTVFDCEVKEYFQSIIEPLSGYSDASQSNQPLSLCWECTAIVKKTVNFRKQVQNAHSLLIEYMIHQTTTLPCLSNLTLHMVPSKVEVKLDEDILKETLQPKTTELLAFIKEEEDDDDFRADSEGYFVENDKGDVDDKDLKAVLKTDLLSYGDQKSEKKKKKKEDIEFDDSDDEPLKKRTEKKTEVEDEVELPEEYKPRGKRKKKDNESVNNSKKAKGKREAPAGVVHNARVARKLQRLGVPPGALDMLVLSWEQVEEERQKALSCALFTRHSYRCTLCAVGFNHRLKLDNHMKKHDPSSGPLVCSSCRIRCKDRGAMCSHRRRHQVRWRCSVCGELSSRAEVAADHFARAHGSAAPTHTCKLCGHTAATLGKLRNHMKNHSERQKCELCGKSFRDRASLRTHLFIHKAEKEYACARCGKLFLFKKALEAHLITHDAPADLYCHQCDVNFKNRSSYYQHMKYNLKHIDPAKLKYACSLCDKKFAKPARLREHNVAVHLKATPVSCTVPGCTFACSSRPVLRTHIGMIHRNLRAVKNHVCHTCGKAYSTKKNLEGHMRSHTGERPFSCALCSSTFAYEAALYNHNKLVHKAKDGHREPPAPPQPAPPPPPPPPRPRAGRSRSRPSKYRILSLT